MHTGQGVVNSLALKDNLETFKQQARLVRQYGAAAVVMAFDEKGRRTVTRARSKCANACTKF